MRRWKTLAVCVCMPVILPLTILVAIGWTFLTLLWQAADSWLDLFDGTESRGP